jgi:hypothetical protein
MDLESSLGLFMAQQANRRATEMAQRTQQAAQQSTQQSMQQTMQQGVAQAAQPTSPQAGAGLADAASQRNERVGQSWCSFRQGCGAGVDAATTAPVSDAQRQAIYGRDAASAPPAVENAAQAARGRPQTNQDLINKYFKQGGGTWAGASKAARAEGRTLNELVKDRKAIASPATMPAGNAAQTSGATAPSGEPAAQASGSSGARSAPAQRASTTSPASGAARVSGSSLSGSAFGNQVAAAAERSARRLNTVGKCALGVNNALVSLGVQGRGHAYQKAEQLERNPRFREVNVAAGDLPKLPAGAVVVWGKSAAKPWGHVSVALGDGREASDHIQRQMTGGRYGTNFGNGPDPQGRQFRVFIPN